MLRVVFRCYSFVLICLGHATFPTLPIRCGIRLGNFDSKRPETASGSHLVLRGFLKCSQRARKQRKRLTMPPSSKLRSASAFILLQSSCGSLRRMKSGSSGYGRGSRQSHVKGEDERLPGRQRSGPLCIMLAAAAVETAGRSCGARPAAMPRRSGARFGYLCQKFGEAPLARSPPIHRMEECRW